MIDNASWQRSVGRRFSVSLASCWRFEPVVVVVVMDVMWIVVFVAGVVCVAALVYLWPHASGLLLCDVQCVARAGKHVHASVTGMD